MNYLAAILSGIVVAIACIYLGLQITNKLFPRPKLHKSYGSADAIADKVEKILKKREKKR